jgi:hypothetical protein
VFWVAPVVVNRDVVELDVKMGEVEERHLVDPVAVWLKSLDSSSGHGFALEAALGPESFDHTLLVLVLEQWTYRHLDDDQKLELACLVAELAHGIEEDWGSVWSSGESAPSLQNELDCPRWCLQQVIQLRQELMVVRARCLPGTPKNVEDTSDREPLLVVSPYSIVGYVSRRGPVL